MWWLQLWYNSVRVGNQVVINSEKLRSFEDERIRSEKVDVEQNLRILDALYEEALMLGALPLKDPLEGIEVKIRVAKAVNNVQRSD
jgi:hypothetical protein